jgi:hypothetical protein
MVTVLISGSRSVKALPAQAVASLERIVAQGLHVAIGDCPWGVDRLVQNWLAGAGHMNVTVYHRRDEAPRYLASTLFFECEAYGNSYTERDWHMCSLADFGLAIWDGSSPGTRSNIHRVPRTKVVRVGDATK